jgi:hypothetical protein
MKIKTTTRSNSMRKIPPMIPPRPKLNMAVTPIVIPPTASAINAIAPKIKPLKAF